VVVCNCYSLLVDRSLDGFDGFMDQKDAWTTKISADTRLAHKDKCTHTFGPKLLSQVHNTHIYWHFAVGKCLFVFFLCCRLLAYSS